MLQQCAQSRSTLRPSLNACRFARHAPATEADIERSGQYGAEGGDKGRGIQKCEGPTLLVYIR